MNELAAENIVQVTGIQETFTASPLTFRNDVIFIELLKNII